AGAGAAVSLHRLELADGFSTVYGTNKFVPFPFCVLQDFSAAWGKPCPSRIIYGTTTQRCDSTGGLFVVCNLLNSCISRAASSDFPCLRYKPAREKWACAANEVAFSSSV